MKTLTAFNHLNQLNLKKNIVFYKSVDSAEYCFFYKLLFTFIASPNGSTLHCHDFLG